jgi:putative ABC transport system permease protein
MWKLALRNLLRHKARSAFTLLAISAGVVGLVLSGGFVQDIYVQLGEMLIHSQSGHLQVSRTGYHEQGARRPEKYLLEDTEPLRHSIASLPQVEDVMGRVFFSGLLNNGRSDLPIVGEGVEPDRERRLGSNLRITAGRQLEDADTGGILIGHGLAQALQLKPGDRTILLLNTTGGAVNSLDVDVVGVFQSFSKDYDARAVRIPLATAQDLLATAGVNTLVVSLKRTQDTDAVRRVLSERLAGQDLEVKTWHELNDFYAKTVTLYEVQFGALRLIILLMVLLSVANSVNTSVFERVAEFGTMMALGNRSRTVFRLILVENCLLGLAGAGLGVVLGVLLALAISAVGIPMPPPPNSDLPYTGQIRLVPSVVAGAFGVGFLATLGAALMPALKVRRIPVVDALRQSI